MKPLFSPDLYILRGRPVRPEGAWHTRTSKVQLQPHHPPFPFTSSLGLAGSLAHILSFSPSVPLFSQIPPTKCPLYLPRYDPLLTSHSQDRFLHEACPHPHRPSITCFSLRGLGWVTAHLPLKVVALTIHSGQLLLSPAWRHSSGYLKFL